MSRPVVLHLTGLSPTKRGGFEKWLEAVIRASDAQGMQTLIGVEAMPSSPAVRQGVEAAGARFVVAPLRGRHPRRVASLVRRLLTQWRPQVVVSHFPGAMVEAGLGMLDRVGLLPPHVRVMHSEPGWKTRLQARLALGRAARVVAVSEAVASQVRTLTSRPVSAHYLGLFPSSDPVDPVPLRWGGPTAPVVMTTAFGDPVKGVDVLLDALVLLRAKGVPFRGLIVGTAPDHPLARRAQELGLGDAVHFAGVVEGVERYLARADVYVQPSRSEALGLGALEAMQAGLPVVASDVGGLPELVVPEVTGALASPGRAASLAQALERLLVDPAARARMGAAGKERAATGFDGEASAQAFAQLLADLV